MATKRGLTLEVGREYVARDGTVVVIEADPCPSAFHKFRGYTTDGEFHAYLSADGRAMSTGEDDDLDLIAEAPCSACDNTGLVHDQTGEFRGVCPDHAPTPTPSEPEVSEAEVERAAIELAMHDGPTPWAELSYDDKQTWRSVAWLVLTDFLKHRGRS